MTADISDRLRSRLDRPDGVPAHWAPMHGDLAPWNLRRVGHRSLWLLDWDDAGWGPPGADAVYYEATASVVRRRRPVRGSAPAETLHFWAERVERRISGGIDRTYNIALLTQLAGMA
jgi:thiamine kinase-like enzyme